MESVSAIEEAQSKKKDPSLGNAYTDIDVMMKELHNHKELNSILHKKFNGAENFRTIDFYS
jgi:hypothetical protein